MRSGKHAMLRMEPRTGTQVDTYEEGVEVKALGPSVQGGWRAIQVRQHPQARGGGVCEVACGKSVML